MNLLTLKDVLNDTNGKEKPLLKWKLYFSMGILFNIEAIFWQPFKTLHHKHTPRRKSSFQTKGKMYSWRKGVLIRQKDFYPYQGIKGPPLKFYLENLENFLQFPKFLWIYFQKSIIVERALLILPFQHPFTYRHVNLTFYSASFGCSLSYSALKKCKIFFFLFDSPLRSHVMFPVILPIVVLVCRTELDLQFRMVSMI